MWEGASEATNTIKTKLFAGILNTNKERHLHLQKRPRLPTCHPQPSEWQQRGPTIFSASRGSCMMALCWEVMSHRRVRRAETKGRFSESQSAHTLSPLITAQGRRCSWLIKSGETRQPQRHAMRFVIRSRTLGLFQTSIMRRQQHRR